MIIVSSKALPSWKLLTEWILHVFTAKKEWQLRHVIEVLDKAVVVIVLQDINIRVSNQHIVYLKLTQCYTSIMVQ